jgi:Tol biopolymer transport system component
MQLLLDAAPFCAGGVSDQCTASDAPAIPARVLNVAVLHVRALGDTFPATLDPQLRVTFPLEDTIVTPGATTRQLHVYPFHRAFAASGRAWFRPTWSADGKRIAFSDGLRLRIWTIGQPASDTVPNTSYASSAAWSPDGSWIAFSTTPILDELSTTCLHRDTRGIVLCTEKRIYYNVAADRLRIVHPDGTGLADLGEGAEPAWSPDSHSIYFQRGASIWVMNQDGTGAAQLPGIPGAEPAISPDGKWIAYAQPTAGGQKDLWVAQLSTR